MGVASAVQSALLVGTGGFLGAVVRYSVSLLIPQFVHTSQVFTATLFVNFTGSFLFGLVASWGNRHIQMTADVQLLIFTGFLGSYTTFSTFANEVTGLARMGEWQFAGLYIFVTNILCVAGAWSGVELGKHV